MVFRQEQVSAYRNSVMKGPIEGDCAAFWAQSTVNQHGLILINTPEETPIPGVKTQLNSGILFYLLFYMFLTIFFTYSETIIYFFFRRLNYAETRG